MAARCFILLGFESSSSSNPLSPSPSFPSCPSTGSSLITKCLLLSQRSVLRLFTIGLVHKSSIRLESSQRWSCCVFKEKWFKLLQTNVVGVFHSYPLLDVLLASCASAPDQLCCLFPICSVTAVSNIGHSTRWCSSGNGAAAGREMRQYRMADNVEKGKIRMWLVPCGGTVSREDSELSRLAWKKFHRNKKWKRALRSV